MTDLLKYRIFGRLAASRSYPLAAQILTLVGFALLIAGGLAAPHVQQKMTGFLRNTNLAALIVWSLWWPLVIISASLLGRVWCQVCPMELVNSLFSRIGLKRRVPRFIASGWGTAVFYSLALLGFIRTFWAHRYPERMSFFFLFLFASTVIAGLIFEKRTFCNFLCPVGRLLGLYACCAPVEWRVRDAKTCEACRGKDCVAVRHAYRLTARSCTSNLYPASIGDNRNCLVCTQCRKVCPSANLRLSLRRPMADFFGGLRLGGVEFFLLFLVSGLVVWELAEEWSPARSVLEFLPAKAFGLLFLPVVAVGHLVKAVFRITSRLPYYSLAFKDPVGYSTARLIAAGDLKVDTRIADSFFPWMTGLALLVFAGAMLSVWSIGLKNPASHSSDRSRRLSHLVIATVYGAALILITLFGRF
jgi:hypothetical protein